MIPDSDMQAYRASILHFTADPGLQPNAYEWIEGGFVKAVGDYVKLKNGLPPDAVMDASSGKLIVPGFHDTHVHYPQTDMIASPAPGLLPWLDTYTFPTERQFSNPDHANDVADFFVRELLRCGTTTAMVYCTVHPASVDAFF